LIVSWMANVVWSLHAAELIGLDVRHMNGFTGDYDSSDKYRRGAGEFPGMFSWITLQSELAVFQTLRVAMQHRCSSQIGFDGILVGSAESRAAAEAKFHGEQSQYEAALAACSKVEEAQRDLYAPQFRQLRDRVIASRTRLRDSLTAWRK